MVKSEVFTNFPLWTCIKKNQHNHFWVHGHSSWSIFYLHLVRGPKALIDVLRKSDHGSWTMEKGHLSWSDLTVHIVNRPLVEHHSQTFCTHEPGAVRFHANGN